MKKLTEKQRKWGSILALLLLVLFFLFITVFLGKPLVRLFEDPAVFREWVEARGWGARILFVGMVVLQVIVALIPGEPLEIAAGFAFGALEGTLLCLAGIAIGSAVVFLLVRTLGTRLVAVFFSMEKIQSLKFLQNEKRFHQILFLLMFIPGTPKDLISYFVGLTPMKLEHWVILTTLARIPSVVTSTVGGNAIGEADYTAAVIVFLASGLVSLGGIALYNRITKKRKEKKTDRES